MSNTTDTNQASEDDLELIVVRISSGIDGFGKLTSGTRYDGISEEAGVELLKAYIRTEKLKLLAEVRERVVGDGDPVDAEILKKLYDKAYSKGYNDKGYENSYNSQDYRSAEDIAPIIAKIRGGYDKRLANLTKLEANQ